MSVPKNKILMLTFLTLTLLLTIPSKVNSTSFTIILLPDTQYYSDSYPYIFTSQTQWIVDNKDSLNIVFVIHEGDIVNHPDDLIEWDRANTSLSLLDGVVPYSLLLGNHDTPEFSRNSTNFNNTFATSRFEAMGSLGGVYTEGKLDNAYYTFNSGEINWLVLALEYVPRDDRQEWAKSIGENFPKHNVIGMTHAYLDNGGSRLTWVNDPWEKVFSQLENMRYVFCGHINNPPISAKRRVDQGKNGAEVHQILANYQGLDPEGGNGYLRIMKFDTDLNNVEVETYSPYLDEYLRDDDNEFTLTTSLIKSDITINLENKKIPGLIQKKGKSYLEIKFSKAYEKIEGYVVNVKGKIQYNFSARRKSSILLETKNLDTGIYQVLFKTNSNPQVIRFAII